jgi:mutator protein MutT
METVAPQRRAQRPPVIDVVAAVMSDGKRILLAERSDHGRWEFPGGKVAPGETPAEALRRELREEFGIDATIGAQLDVTEHPASDRVLRLIFLAVERYTGRIDLRDHMRIAWVDPAELPSYDLMPADVPFALRMAAGLHRPPGARARRKTVAIDSFQSP